MDELKQTILSKLEERIKHYTDILPADGWEDFFTPNELKAFGAYKELTQLKSIIENM